MRDESLHAQLTELESLQAPEWVPFKSRLEQIAEHAHQLADLPAESKALWMLGGCAYIEGRSEDTLQLNIRALRLCQQFGDKVLECKILNSLGGAKRALGFYDQALSYYIDSLKITQQTLNHKDQTRVMANIAIIYEQIGEIDKAYELQKSVLEFSLKEGLWYNSAGAAISIAEIQLKRQFFEEALHFIEEYQDLIQNYGDPIWMHDLMLVKGKALLALNKVSESAAIISMVHQAVQESGRLTITIPTLNALAAVLLAQKKFPLAEQTLKEALKLNESLPDQPSEADTHDLMVQLSQEQGDYKKAFDHLKESYRIRQKVQLATQQSKAHSLALQTRIEFLEREAEIERLRNVELAAANEALQKSQAALAYYIAHNPLTDLMNEQHFMSNGQIYLEQLPENYNIILAIIKIDRLSHINLEYGHDVGRDVIKVLASRIAQRLTSSQQAGHIYNDSFIIIMGNPKEDRMAIKDFEILLNSLKAPYTVGDVVIDLTIITSYKTFTISSDHPKDIEDLRKQVEQSILEEKFPG